jgi:putative Holliday junction resolvase
MPAASHNFILSLDVGGKRVGVAVASLIARLPRPLTTLEQSETFFDDLANIVESEDIGAIVVGFPRGLSGQHTQQTSTIEDFTKQLRQHFDLPIHFQDEALTSQKAEEELEARGAAYKKGDIDALAATYILDDFLTDHQNLEGVTT